MKSKIKQIFYSAMIAATLTFSGAANAGIYNFAVTGDYSATWVMDSATVEAYWIPGYYVYANITGKFDRYPYGAGQVRFYEDGGLQILGIEYSLGPALLLYGNGPVLYTGSRGAYEFPLGTFSLSGYRLGYVPGNFTLTISAVPEAETYAMLVAGLGLLGVVARRRQKST